MVTEKRNESADGNDGESAEKEQPINISTADDVDIDEGDSNEEVDATVPTPAPKD